MFRIARLSAGARSLASHLLRPLTFLMATVAATALLSLPLSAAVTFTQTVVAAYLINLPSHGDREHLQRRYNQDPRKRVRDEVGIVEGDSPGKAGIFQRCIRYYFATESTAEWVIAKKAREETREQAAQVVYSGRPRPLVCEIDELEAGEGARSTQQQ